MAGTCARTARKNKARDSSQSHRTMYLNNSKSRQSNTNVAVCQPMSQIFGVEGERKRKWKRKRWRQAKGRNTHTRLDVHDPRPEKQGEKSKPHVPMGFPKVPSGVAEVVEACIAVDFWPRNSTDMELRAGDVASNP